MIRIRNLNFCWWLDIINSFNFFHFLNLNPVLNNDHLIQILKIFMNLLLYAHFDSLFILHILEFNKILCFYPLTIKFAEFLARLDFDDLVSLLISLQLLWVSLMVDLSYLEIIIILLVFKHVFKWLLLEKLLATQSLYYLIVYLGNLNFVQAQSLLLGNL